MLSLQHCLCLYLDFPRSHHISLFLEVIRELIEEDEKFQNLMVQGLQLNKVRYKVSCVIF